MEEEFNLPAPHDYWIDRPDGVPFMAWLAINQVRHLCAIWGEEELWKWVRTQLPGHNFARWWRKYGPLVRVE